MPRDISLYRSQLVEADVLDRIIVGRERLLQDLLRGLGTSARRRHYFLNGPGGIGKTSFIRLLCHRLEQDPELSRSWLTAIVPEEELTAATSVSEFFLLAWGHIMASLSKLDDSPADTCGSVSPNALEEALGALESAFERARERDAKENTVRLWLDAFSRFHRDTGLRIVFALEKVERLLALEKTNVRASSVQKIRCTKGVPDHFLEPILGASFLTVVCTSSVAIYEPRLSPFFRFKHLRPLTLDQQIEAMARVADVRGDGDVLLKIEALARHLRALAHYVRGNPRVINILYELFADEKYAGSGAIASIEPNLAIKTEVDFLLDRLTPRYQAVLASFSPQEAKVVSALAAQTEASSPTDLARNLGMERKSAKVLRTVLSKLKREGFLAKTTLGNRALYYIKDVLLRIWLQANRGPVMPPKAESVLAFFSSWYSNFDNFFETDFYLNGPLASHHDEKRTRAKDWGERLFFLRCSPTNNAFQGPLARARGLLFAGKSDAVEEELAALDERHSGCVDYLNHKAFLLSEDLHKHGWAVKAFKEALRLQPSSLATVFNTAVSFDRNGQKARAQTGYLCTAHALAPAVGVGIGQEEALLYTLFQSSHSGLGALAACLLGRFGMREHSKLILNTLLEEGALWRRHNYLIALGLLECKEAVEDVVRCAHASQSDKSIFAIRALGLIGGCRATEVLMEILSVAVPTRGNDPVASRASSVFAPEQRAEAARALGLIAEVEAVPVLVRCLSDRSGRVRSRSADALAKIGSAQAIGPLMQAMKSSDPFLRARSASALGCLGARQAAKSLITALSDQAPYVREKAACSLGNMHVPEAATPLVRALRTAPSKSMACAASVAVCRLASHVEVEDLVFAAAKVLELAEERAADKTHVVAQLVLCNAAESGNSGKLEAVLGVVSDSEGADFRELCSPYRVALRYWEGGNDSRVLESQHPEIREAVNLIIDATERRREIL